MGKWWSLFFGVTMLACAALFFAAPLVGWWLPEGVSEHAGSIDNLFYIILAITAFFFFLTEFLLCYFMFIYAGKDRPVVTNRADLPPFMRLMSSIAGLIPKFLHDQHRVEMAWTIVPAIILLYIAFAQVSTWAEVKYLSRSPNYTGKTNTPLQVAVSARQFEWRMRYPSPERLRQWLGARTDKAVLKDIETFAKTPQADDVYVVNEFHAWKGYPVVAQITTRDVIHSFNLPHFRVKQDALPGRSIPAWFVPTKANVARQGSTWVDGMNPQGQPDPAYAWDIPCAELCGWGHFRMIGRVYIHDSQDDFLAWLDQAAAENSRGKNSKQQQVAEAN